jgi:hypothetical protein
MRKQFLLLCGIALSSVAAAVPANAQPLLFELSGSRTATFTLDSSTPDSFTSSFIGDQIFFNDVVGTFGGTPGTADLSFGTNLISAFQVQSASLDFTQFSGPALFSGPASSPTFNLGTFNLSGILSGNSTLTISQAAPGAVPEPGTWAMMLVGFGALGVSMRRRRRAGTQLQVS